ncbi:MAG TPA: helix-turn-helix domain-containing protein [Burkholderiales bacterium]|nr:helix-turn-helix domain-containing protein [Burkholderiales bacterium]
MSVERFCTVAEAAAVLGVTPGRVRQLLSEGRIIGARKHGRDWLIPAPVRVREVPRGRPPRQDRAVKA